MPLFRNSSPFLCKGLASLPEPVRREQTSSLPNPQIHRRCVLPKAVGSIASSSQMCTAAGICSQTLHETSINPLVTQAELNSQTTVPMPSVAYSMRLRRITEPYAQGRKPGYLTLTGKTNLGQTYVLRKQASAEPINWSRALVSSEPQCIHSRPRMCLKTQRRGFAELLL